MTTEQIYILIGGLNLALTAFLIFKVFSLKNKVGDVKVAYFSNTMEKEGFIGKKKRVQIKAQLYIRDIPIGHSFVISEQEMSEVTPEKVESFLKHVIEPISKMGIKTTIRKLAG